MVKGEKVICVNDGDVPGINFTLTIGKVYTLIGFTFDDAGTYYSLRNDLDYVSYYNINRFIKLSVYREEIIDYILE